MARKNFCADCQQEITYYSTRCRSCAQKHRFQQIEQRQALSQRTRDAWKSGKLGDKGWRRNQSQAAKARWANGVYENINTKEVCHKRSKALRAAWKRKNAKLGNEDWRRRNSEASKAAWARGVYKNRYTKSLRRRLAEALKQRWKNGDFDGAFQSPSSLELRVMDALSELGIECIFQYRPKNCSYPFDFYIPNLHLLIEVDGTFWHHSNWAKKHGLVERDRKKEKIAFRLGYNLLRISECELKAIDTEELPGYLLSRIEDGRCLVVENKGKDLRPHLGR